MYTVDVKTRFYYVHVLLNHIYLHIPFEVIKNNFSIHTPSDRKRQSINQLNGFGKCKGYVYTFSEPSFEELQKGFWNYDKHYEFLFLKIELSINYIYMYYHMVNLKFET